MAGTFVVEGEGEAHVTATGGRTVLASLARQTQRGRRRRTPLAMELDRLVRVIAAIAVGIGVGFFGLSYDVTVPPHPRREPLEVGQRSRSVRVRRLAHDVSVDAVGVGPVGLHGDGGEALLLDQPLRDCARSR